jgi:hypothetical protein
VNTWYHIAVTRSGSDYYFFVDGVSQAVTLTTNGNPPNISTTLHIGEWGADSSYLDGWLDYIRLSKGYGIWTSNFTPPFV